MLAAFNGRRSALGCHLLLLGALGMALWGCGPREEPFPGADELDLINQLWGLPRPPEDPTNRYANDPSARLLGERLFSDPLLSRCGTVSCATCHDEAAGLTFPDSFSPGCDGARTGRNSPTLFNAGHQDWFMWDGRADRLWSQPVLPFTSPNEMSSDVPLLRERLQAAYGAEYAALFGKAPSEELDGNRLLANFGKALAAYMLTFEARPAPFDTDVKSFIEDARAGKAEQHKLFLAMKTYVRKGQCITCHSGPALSDRKFHNIALTDAGDGRRGRLAGIQTVLASPLRADSIYSDERDGAAANRLAALANEDPVVNDGAFKTPTLRNIALTGPYMHSGAIPTLEEVVEFYNRGGDPEGSFSGTRTETIRPLNLTEAEKAALLALLRSMTGG